MVKTTPMAQTPGKSGRIWELDALRGITLISMAAYHAMWDLVYLFGLRADWYNETPGYLWQQSICWCFILLSGFCWGLGRRPLKRGLMVFGGGALVTAVTVLVMPAERVVFGGADADRVGDASDDPASYPLPEKSRPSWHPLAHWLLSSFFSSPGMSPAAASASRGSGWGLYRKRFTKTT